MKAHINLSVALKVAIFILAFDLIFLSSRVVAKRQQATLLSQRVSDLEATTQRLRAATNAIDAAERKMAAGDPLFWLMRRLDSQTPNGVTHTISRLSAGVEMRKGVEPYTLYTYAVRGTGTYAGIAEFISNVSIREEFVSVLKLELAEPDATGLELELLPFYAELAVLGNTGGTENQTRSVAQRN